MKCKVCNCEVSSGIAKCSRCGFPVLQMVQGNADEEKRMNDLASSFRKKKIERTPCVFIIQERKKVYQSRIARNSL